MFQGNTLLKCKCPLEHFTRSSRHCGSVTFRSLAIPYATVACIQGRFNDETVSLSP